MLLIDNATVSCDDPAKPECADFTLEGKSCWMSVNNLSVYIAKMPHGLRVEIYPKGNEHESSLIDCAQASFRKKYNMIQKSVPENDHMGDNYVRQ